MLKQFLISVAVALSFASPAAALPDIPGLQLDTMPRDMSHFSAHERASIFGYYDWYSDVPTNKRRRDRFYDHYNAYTDDFERNRVAHAGQPPKRYRDALKSAGPAPFAAGDVLSDLSGASEPPKPLQRNLRHRAATQVVLVGPHLVLLDRETGTVLDVIAHVAR